ncbi:MAG TPA: hypothetical protein DIV86_02985, partial [Alphaproteobacteria bacterium]|nr:hypothetical protein [Alphaproteobacteria bacterium]
LPEAKPEGRIFRYLAGNLIEEEEKEFTRSDISKTTQDNYKKGYDEGYKKASDEVKKQTLDVEAQNSQNIQQIADTLSNINTQIENEKSEFKKQFIEFCKAALQNVSQNIFNEKAAEVFAKAIDEAIPVIPQNRKIFIKAEQRILDKLKLRMEEKFKDKNFVENVIFEVDNKNLNTCRLEWDNSGINIDLNEKLKQVTEIFDDYLKSI